MTVKTVTLEIQIPDDFYKQLREAFLEIDEQGVYDNDFDNFLYDTVDLRVLRHMKENIETMLDHHRHFSTQVQT